jgi:hypothetical protein
MQYYYRRMKHKSVIHWGQRKLIASEIEFITTHGINDDIVVYAGAAPGNHIQLLGRMFPSIFFYLYDPNAFSIKETDNIKIFQQYFTDDDAKKYTGRSTLFISDIRTADPKVHSLHDIELLVEKDNLMQMAWVTNMRPKVAMLKFRLPWRVPSAGKVPIQQMRDLSRIPYRISFQIPQRRYLYTTNCENTREGIW